MKLTLILTTLALAPALWAAEPSSSPQEGTSTNAPPSQQELAEQAALVQQIGAEAARGFDAEAHAKAIRAQIEALLGKPATGDKAPLPSETPAAVVPRSPARAPNGPAPVPEEVRPAPVTTSAPAESGLRQVIQKMRAALDQLETQLSRRKE